MLSTLSSFTHIINCFEILVQDIRSDLSKTKVKLILKAYSVLFLREIIIDGFLFDYSYHWQSAQGLLIIRWDNAAHYPYLETFPHHKYIGTENNVECSHERNLGDVLHYINNQLNIVL